MSFYDYVVPAGSGAPPPPTVGLEGAYISASALSQNVIVETAVLGPVVVEEGASFAGGPFFKLLNSDGTPVLIASGLGDGTPKLQLTHTLPLVDSGCSLGFLGTGWGQIYAGRFNLDISGTRHGYINHDDPTGILDSAMFMTINGHSSTAGVGLRINNEPGENFTELDGVYSDWRFDFGAGNGVGMFVSSADGYMFIFGEAGSVPASRPTANARPFQVQSAAATGGAGVKVWTTEGGALRMVVADAANSGPSGFRVLRVAN
jgi:hypothetical protein